MVVREDKFNRSGMLAVVDGGQHDSSRDSSLAITAEDKCYNDKNRRKKRAGNRNTSGSWKRGQAYVQCLSLEDYFRPRGFCR